MGENSKIEWCDHTHNIVWGCQKVSPACEHCYAEAFDKRVGGSHWGPNTRRRQLSDANWAKPLKWNRDAAKAGKRARVFCSSMADVFEEHPDLDAPRRRLWDLIRVTPHLDWLLLTKRPENLAGMLPWGYEPTTPWPNVWLGVTAENQEWADKRIPMLLEMPAAVRFVSCEPLLGSLDLTSYLGAGYLDWVIVGGESGGGARPMRSEWAQSIRDQCVVNGVAFHFKQWGAWADGMVRIGKKAAGRELQGRTWDEFPGVAR